MKKVFALATLSTLVASAAFAAQSGGKSTATTAEKAPSFVDKLGIQYLGSYYGSSINDPLDNKTPNELTGAKEGNIGYDHEIRLNYKYSQDFSFGVSQAFSQNLGEGVKAYDTFARVVTPGIVKSTNFSVDNQLRVYFPVSVASQEKNLITQLRMIQSLSYTFHNPRLSFTTDFSERAYLYSDTTYDAKGNRNQRRYRFYAAPFLNYQINSKVVGSIGLETEADKKVGASPFTKWSSMGTHLEPKVSWDIIPTINVAAYPKVPVGKRIAADTTVYEIDLVASIL